MGAGLQGSRLRMGPCDAASSQQPAGNAPVGCHGTPCAAAAWVMQHARACACLKGSPGWLLNPMV